jgi:F-type H+-transporting ATPase subunit b
LKNPLRSSSHGLTQPRFFRMLPLGNLPVFLPVYLPVLLFFALAMIPSASPRAWAQAPAPQAAAPDSSTASQDANSAQGDSAQTEEQQELDTFRHAPIVARIGHKMGLDVETSARIFEFINFLIIFLAIVIPLGRYLPRILRNRSQTLNREIQAAREATADAAARLKAVEAQLAGLAGEIARYRTQVEQESLEDEKRIKATLEEETARIVASAEQEIAAAAAQARRGLRHFAADLAIGQAEKQIALTPETDRALISEFIAEAGRNGAGKGGAN